MRYPTTKTTPRNMRYALCDLCGFKFHIKELILVKEHLNRHKGLLVCHKDYSSIRPNPQDKPKVVKEELVKYPDKIRPRRDIEYITNENDDRAPSRPFDGFVYTDTLDGSLTLQWSAPQDQGSSPVKYYKILYSVPQRFNYILLTENSETNVPYFKDTVNFPTTHVSFKVAAVNGYGQSGYSDEFFWPTDDYADILSHGVQYWSTGDFNLIATGTGEPIVLSGIMA